MPSGLWPTSSHPGSTKMPIEFRCTQCQKLLRTQDDTAGKQAKCPHCGAMVSIPLPGGSEPFGGPLPSQGNPFDSAGGPPPVAGIPGALPPVGGFGVPGVGAAQPPGFNPYQSPAFGGGGGMPFQGSRGPRSGPPWERDGASFGSFFATVKECFSSPAGFFSDMRREGGIGAPLGFAMAGGLPALLISIVIQVGLQVLIGAAGGGNQGAGAMFGASIPMLVLVVVCAPIGLIIGLFLWSGIYHLMLMMFGGANFPFETTFRVVSYTAGVTYLLQLIPFCGGLIGAVVMIVFTIIGLANAQETSGGKAAAAVLVPFLVCCCAAVGLYAFVIAAAVGAANQGGGFNP